MDHGVFFVWGSMGCATEDFGFASFLVGLIWLSLKHSYLEGSATFFNVVFLVGKKF